MMKRCARGMTVIIAYIFVFMLFMAAPADLAQADGRSGGSGRTGGGGRAGSFGAGGVTGGSRSGGSVSGGVRGGVIGRGDTPSFSRPSFHRHSYSDHFYFGFGASAFAPAWWWYDPYYSYWGPPTYYPYFSYPYPGYSSYYGYPYPGYFTYPYYGSDPFLSSDPAYTPYGPPAGSVPSQGYGAPPADYPFPGPPPIGSDGRPEQSPYPVNE